MGHTRMMNRLDSDVNEGWQQELSSASSGNRADDFARKTPRHRGKTQKPFPWTDLNLDCHWKLPPHLGWASPLQFNLIKKIPMGVPRSLSPINSRSTQVYNQINYHKEEGGKAWEGKEEGKSGRGGPDSSAALRNLGHESVCSRSPRPGRDGSG